jgi:hypothetical protein
VQIFFPIVAPPDPCNNLSNFESTLYQKAFI